MRLRAGRLVAVSASDREEGDVVKYFLLRTRLTPETWARLLQSPEDRRAVPVPAQVMAQDHA